MMGWKGLADGRGTTTRPSDSDSPRPDAEASGERAAAGPTLAWSRAMDRSEEPVDVEGDHEGPEGPRGRRSTVMPCRREVPDSAARLARSCLKIRVIFCLLVCDIFQDQAQQTGEKARLGR